MNKYLVIWAINVEADSPKEAAKEARKAQVAPGTLAKIFDVYKEEPFEYVETIDLIPHPKHMEYEALPLPSRRVTPNPKDYKKE